MFTAMVCSSRITVVVTIGGGSGLRQIKGEQEKAPLRALLVTLSFEQGNPVCYTKPPWFCFVLGAGKGRSLRRGSGQDRTEIK